MTADERLALVWHKIERADKHIRDLNAAITTFRATNPYKFGTKNNPQSGQPRYYISGMQPIPAPIPIIMGDAVQNLRTALDHLATQLYQVGTGGSGYLKDTCFYIHPKWSEYKRHFAGKVQGMRQEAIDALAACEPYERGKGKDFCVLHALNNIDKHRALVATAAGFEAVDFMPKMRVFMPPKMREAYRSASLFLRPASYLCPLKIGDEIPIDATAGEEKLDPYVHFLFDVALYEPQIVKPGPMLEIVQNLADLVRNTVRSFKPLLV